MTKPTIAENADTIVTTTMTETASADETDGHDDDDQRWAEVVIASLPSRSSEARKALAEALLDGGGSMPLLAPFSCSRKCVTVFINPGNLLKKAATENLAAQLEIILNAPFSDLNGEQRHVIREVAGERHPARRWLSIYELPLIEAIRSAQTRIAGDEMWEEDVEADLKSLERTNGR